MSDLKTPRQILEDRNIKVNELGADKPMLLFNILRAMDDFADQYYNWKKAIEANKQPDTEVLRLQNVKPYFYKEDYINWQNKYFKPCNRVYDFQTIGKDEFFTKEQLHKKYEKAMLESPFK